MRPDASENSQISPSTIVRAARAAGSHPQLASVLLQGRKSANIHASSGVIRGIPVKSVLPFVDPAAEKAPMTRVPYVRQIIAQLHDVATSSSTSSAATAWPVESGARDLRKFSTVKIYPPIADMLARESRQHPTACHSNQGGYKNRGEGRDTRYPKSSASSIA